MEGYGLKWAVLQMLMTCDDSIEFGHKETGYCVALSASAWSCDSVFVIVTARCLL
jgi:hypothetical protein